VKPSDARAAKEFLLFMSGRMLAEIAREFQHCAARVQQLIKRADARIERAARNNERELHRLSPREWAARKPLEQTEELAGRMSEHKRYSRRVYVRAAVPRFKRIRVPLEHTLDAAEPEC
jgi:hypothetical protein